MDRHIRTLIIGVCATFALSAPVFARTLGTFGNTYSIAERDGLDEIREKAKKVDWAKYFNAQNFSKRMAGHEKSFEFILPKAKADNSRLVDITYTLPFDIYDTNGKVLYPRGFTFKPLQYMPMPYSIIVIDGSDKSQIKWLKASGYGTKVAAMVLTTGGETAKLIKELKRPVYVADRRIVDRFRLRAVPSVIVQKGLYVEVQEIVVPDKK